MIAIGLRLYSMHIATRVVTHEASHLLRVIPAPALPEHATNFVVATLQNDIQTIHGSWWNQPAATKLLPSSPGSKSGTKIINFNN